jgi:hypothetical protein
METIESVYGTGELTDEQLDLVAGGFGNLEILLVIGLVSYAGGWVTGLLDYVFGDD